MRPDRFETLLHGLLTNDPRTATVQTATEAGVDRSRYGLVVTYPTGQRVLLQITVASAPADRFDQPEQIIEGDTAPAEVPVPDVYDDGKLRLDRVDQHLTALVLNSGSREVASATAYSTRPKPGAVPYGARIEFHDGCKVFVNVVHAVPPGREGWPHRAFDVPATV